MSDGDDDQNGNGDPPCIRSIKGVRCCLCGGSKYKGRTFCETCCVAAGPAVRAMLCVSADAYPAAFERAFEVLGVEAKI